jgi:nucleotide-binding universal stress UspA family protein
MSWKTILVPHDFSTGADHAMAIARDEAKLHGARIVLVHVIDLPNHIKPETVIVPADVGAPINLRDYAIAGAETGLADLAHQLVNDGVAVTAIVRVGSAVDEIAKIADDEHAELIVMGTQGRTGLAHMLLGSVTERVVRTSKVPVLTIRHADRR